MILIKAVRFIVVLLLTAYIVWENKGYRQPIKLLLQGLTHGQESNDHVRKKRDATSGFPFTTAGNCSEENCTILSVNVVLLLDAPDDIEPKELTILLRDATENISSFNITENVLLASLNLTTACYENSTGGYQCHCEDDFIWSSRTCDTYGACSNANSKTCKCLNGIPSGHFCESAIDPYPTETEAITPRAQQTEVHIVFSVDTSTDSEPTDLVDLMRLAVGNISLPFEMTDNLTLRHLDLTTACFLNSTDGHQCQCEESFGLSCDTCDTYGACRTDGSSICDCINVIPPMSKFCQPISTITPCAQQTEVLIVFSLDTSTDSEPTDLVDLMRLAVGNISLPFEMTDNLTLRHLDLTTACFLKSTEGHQCQCEESFGLLCDTCDTYGACSTDGSSICDCIRGIPPISNFCKPISTITPCAQQTEVHIVFSVDTSTDSEPTDLVDLMRLAVGNISLPFEMTDNLTLRHFDLTTACYLHSTEGHQCQCEESFGLSCDTCDTYGACRTDGSSICDCINGIPQMSNFCQPILTITPCAQQTEVHIVFSVDTSTDSEPTDLVDLMRLAVGNISLPFEMTDNLTLRHFDLTTACYLHSTEGHQCQCEESFGLSCDTCDTYGACRTDGSSICDCINGIPQMSNFCQPILTITPCAQQTEVLIVFSVDTSTDSEPMDLVDLMRLAVGNISLPFEMTDNLTLRHLDLTTACFLNSTEGHQCQCEESFGFLCDTCDTYGACSTDGSSICDCIRGIPPISNFCQPISTITPCAQQTEVHIVFSVDTSTDSGPTDLVDLMRLAVGNISLPFEMTDNLTLRHLDLTTACYLNSNEGHQCQCEESFGLSCDTCDTYGACRTDGSSICDCINGIPPMSSFCQPISTITPCAPQTEVLIIFSVDTSTDSGPTDLVDLMRLAVGNISLPFEMTDNLTLRYLDLTTACYLNSSEGHQCQCEESFGLSCDTCDTYGACGMDGSSICDCIRGIPPISNFCKPISTMTPCAQQTEVHIVFSVDTSTDSEPTDLVDLMRLAVGNISLPFEMTDNLTLRHLDLTTACYLNSSEGHQCQCEESFGLSCDTCDIYGACSTDGSSICDCIRGIPPISNFCKPISTITPCAQQTEVLIVFSLDTSTDSEPTDLVDLMRLAVGNISLPFEMTDNLTLRHLDLTTACYLNSSEGHQCQCEESFGLLCDTCDTYGACSTDGSSICDCIRGIPPISNFCKPISTITPCAQQTEVHIVFSVDTSTDSEPTDLVDLMRLAVGNIYLPFEMTNNLTLRHLDFTTACYPNSTEGHQCQCEESFGLLCDTCDTYEACSTDGSSICDCIHGIPPMSKFCQPISSINPCAQQTEVHIVFSVDTSTDSEPSDHVDLMRLAVGNISLPFEMTDNLTMRHLDLTTACYLNSPEGHQCQCEESFGLSCETCDTYGACSTDGSSICDCIRGIPPVSNFCKPISNVTSACPAPPPPLPPETFVDTILTISTLGTEEAEIIARLKEALGNFSLPFNITDDSMLTNLSLTTVCYTNFDEQLQCQCEHPYLWPCHACETYGKCSKASLESCDCINAIPNDGQYCERNVTSICPPLPTTTPVTPTETFVDTVVTISTLGTEEAEIIARLKEAVGNFSLPFNITDDSMLTNLSLTTVCYTNFDDELQCQCEHPYLWPCHACETYGKCSKASLESCDCINAIPNDGQYCERNVTSICPPPIKTTPTTTPVTPTPPTETFVDTILTISTLGTEEAEIIARLKAAVGNFSLPFNIKDDSVLTNLSLTTVCYSFDEELKCQCEHPYLWPCHACETYGKCSNASLESCDCIYAIPNDGQYCERNVTSICPPIITTTPATTPTTPPVTPTPPPETFVDTILTISTLGTEEAEIIARLKAAVGNFSLPFNITDDSVLTNLSLTTVCYTNFDEELQCRCERPYLWPCHACEMYGKCSNASLESCDCINAIPNDGQYCKRNVTSICPPIITTTPATTPTTPTVTPTPPTETFVDTVLTISTLGTEEAEIIARLKAAVGNFSLPFNITDDSVLTNLSLTTVCYTKFDEELQCQCERPYLWPCHACETYGKCSKADLESCDCINAITNDGQYCERNVTSICPPIITTTPTPVTPTPPTKTFVDIVLTISILSTEEAVINDQLREAVGNISLPFNITDDSVLTNLSLTTVCYTNFDEELQCRCERPYLWPCHACEMYGKCSNASLESCDCINAIPKDGQYCKRNVTSICPPIITTTPPATTPTTPTVTPTPPTETFVDTVLTISTLGTEEAEIIARLKAAVGNFSLPFNITDDSVLTNLSLTTVCYTKFDEELQCQCERPYLWPCHACETYGKCSKADLESCDCINAITNDGQYCERNVTSICPPIITTTPTPVTPTPPTKTFVDIVLTISTLSTEEAVINDQMREAVGNISLPFNITDDSVLTNLSLTTVCYTNFDEELQCRCERPYLWPCHACEMYGKCSNASLESCDCINAIPNDGQYCKRNVTSICPPIITTTPATTPTVTPTPPTETFVDTVLTISTLGTEEAEIIARLKAAVGNFSLPFNITDDSVLTNLSLTTVCYTKFDEELQCQCERPYLWPCHACETYGKCSKADLESCDCINAITNDGQYCERNVTSICPPIITTTPTPVTPTPPTKTFVDIVLTISTLSTEEAVINDQLREAVGKISLPFNITDDSVLTNLSLTTVSL
ncbi:uncharacterized protein LOC130907373 [Corythoichthys intestinalis]|uniref:uncharacterized protein LOC130907373 n=1 Tax=Corythoichthys intestinalis TaxID=161448 RepID=UPI0025A66F81|nr:uncharacterized protein LOC130907373 [Corythoichthys intestinalis]